MEKLDNCPKCNGIYTYEDRGMLVCPECAFEWNKDSIQDAENKQEVKDANGTILQDGDAIIITKDLKVKGSSTSLKAGTKVKKIRLVDGDHNIDCRIEGFGAMQLKSEFVKKA